MKVTMFWHGGASYSSFDTSDASQALIFETIPDAVKWFHARHGAPETPCVSYATPESGGPVAWLFFGDKHPVLGREYPDRVIEYGPRGGLRMYRG